MTIEPLDIIFAIVCLVAGLLIANWKDDPPLADPKVCRECGCLLKQESERCYNCHAHIDVDR